MNQNAAIGPALGTYQSVSVMMPRSGGTPEFLTVSRGLLSRGSATPGGVRGTRTVTRALGVRLQLTAADVIFYLPTV